METNILSIGAGATSETIASRFWWAWLLAMVVVSVIIAATLAYAPFLFMDELMNVDLGRVILHPDTDWSVAWLTQSGKPVYLLSYVGPVLQEYVYQVAGELGPRYSALLGALAAATVLVGWLRASGTARKAAFVLGLVFLLDPIFVQAYTTGRIDGWSMALCLACCWLLRYTALKPMPALNFRLRILLAGALAVLALFFWPSAGFLLPLIVLELIFLARKCWSLSGKWQAAALPLALFLAGGLAAGLLLLLPIAAQLYELADSMVEALKVNVRHGGDVKNEPVFLRLVTPLIDLLRVLKFTPFLVLLALIGAVWKRNLGLLLSGLLVAALMMGTIVYISRVQYLLPYLIASAASIYQMRAVAGRLFARIRLGGLVLVFAWSAGLTLVARTSVALYEREHLNRDLVRQTALKMLGPGNHTVALFHSLEFYYTGRSLGWKMYAPYRSAFTDTTVKYIPALLPYVDYLIIPQQQLTKDYANLLRKAGMRDQGTYLSYKNPVDKDYVKDHSKTTNIDRLHIVYKIEGQPYGPYKLFAREGVNATAVND